MLGYMSADINCSKKETVFQGHSSRRTVSFEEQVMSKDRMSRVLVQSVLSQCNTHFRH